MENLGNNKGVEINKEYIGNMLNSISEIRQILDKTEANVRKFDPNISTGIDAYNKEIYNMRRKFQTFVGALDLE